MSFSKPSPLSGFSVLAMSSTGADFPFPTVIAELHRLLESRRVTYAVIGGVAVARAGTFRTTGDINLLVRREEWRRLEHREESSFRLGPDWAQHRESGVPVGLLFSGDDGDLPFLLPDPESCREWDERGGAWFMTPIRLLELKAAVFLAKRAEYGPAVAAKDLSDVTELLRSRPDLGKPGALKTLHPSVVDTVRGAAAELENYQPKRPKQDLK